MSLFEIVLIGTGGGYGESVLVKFCNNDWMIVDSCIDPNTKEPLPLVYLRSVGVEPSQSVKMILCSHWHDDHIEGIEQVLDACKNAEFCVTIASDKDKFYKFVGYDSRSEKRETSSTKILSQCLDILSNKRMTCVCAVADKLLYKNYHNGIPMEAFCLSPTEDTLKAFGKELSELMNLSNDSNVRLPYLTPNDKCVVMYIAVGEHSVLLGSDYENKNNSWKLLLGSSKVIKGKTFSLVKIPHHGSENAYEETLWIDYVKDNVCGGVSLFKKGKVQLPTTEMLKKYLEHTKDLYITSGKKSDKVHDRELVSAKVIKEMNPSIREIPYNYGAIVCKMDVDSDNPQWAVTLQGSAKKVDDVYLTSFH